LATRRANYDPATVAEIEPGARITATAYLKARGYRDRFAGAIAATLEENGLDALLCPTAPWPALERLPAANDTAMMLEGIATAPFSVAGVPAASVPCGLAEEGLPAGMEIIGGRGADAQILALAIACERAIPPLPRLSP
jgi:aspartyl-tRNA(Asn)/glutamyl-tRNA(Gln) amidotransferase subunit A